MSEGGDAIWLARQGWQVTAVDGQWQSQRLDAPSRQVSGPGGQSATVTDKVIAVRLVAP